MTDPECGAASGAEDADVPIQDPGFYDGPAHEVFARLRREDPVYWYDPLGLWLVTTYEDIRRVGRDPSTFSSAHGLSLNDLRMGSSVSRSFFGELLSTTDPPRHRELRRVIASSFTAPSVKDLEPEIRSLARELLDTVEPGRPVPFVSQIAAVLPLQVIALLLGIPAADAELLRYWSDEMVKSADVRTVEGLDAARANAAPLQDYFNEWIARSIGEDGQQLIRKLVRARQDGQDLVTYEVMHMVLSLVLVAGNETTRNFLSGTVLTLAEHPDQLSVLSRDPTLLPSALEETLRWVTPVRSKVRTVTQPVTMNDRELRPGQHTLSLFMSGNRDESVWENADTFDIRSQRSLRHVAFGFGEHGCLGSTLARLEGRILFEELLSRFGSWSLAGPITRHPSELHNSLDELPVTFSG